MSYSCLPMLDWADDCRQNHGKPVPSVRMLWNPDSKSCAKAVLHMQHARSHPQQFAECTPPEDAQGRQRRSELDVGRLPAQLLPWRQLQQVLGAAVCTIQFSFPGI